MGRDVVSGMRKARTSRHVTEHLVPLQWPARVPRRSVRHMRPLAIGLSCVPVLLCTTALGARVSRAQVASSTHTAPAHSHVRATLADSTFWPEGVDVDPRNGRLYVASVRHRTIAEITPSGAIRELLPRDGVKLGPIFGVRVDTARNVLWATTSAYPQIPGYLPTDSSIAALLEIRIADGSIVHRWNAPAAAGGRVLGDLAVGPRGDVFLTDSSHPVVYWLHHGAGTLDSITSPRFRSLQGMVPTPDGKSVYLADYSRGFFRLDLATRVLAPVIAPKGTSVRGCDGIVWYHGSIVAVQNGASPARIVRFFLDSSGTRIAAAEVIDENTALADEPTIATVLGDELIYVANSQWEKYDARGARIVAKPLTPPILLSLPLPLR